MVGVMKPKNKQPVYFGHPFQFWKERQREEMKAIVNVEDMKKLSDVVEYDLVHLQKREKLKILLEREEEAFIQELATKQEMEECGYCKEKEKRNKGYLEEIEKEKIRECQKALEREKIARGMRSTKEDEKLLKEVQKMQMEEKQAIERSEQDIEMMWHQVLMDDYNRKEYLERLAAQRKQKETLERRRCYDEQIASANKKRQELIRQEREKENRKFENIKKKMERDHYEAIKKKKEQQETNRRNFIEGHEQKLMRIRNEKMRAREIDNGTIRVALEELRKERERNRQQMINLQLEKQICIDNYNRKKRMTSALEEESDKVADEWQQEAHNKTDEYLRQVEEEQRLCKEKAAQEYKRHIQTRNQELQLAKQERIERMERVKRVALTELQRKIDSANEELRKQMEYRHSLSSQIRENEKHLETELINIENKDRTYTKKAAMFKDVMADRYASSSARTSTNPVHPFRRLMETQDKKKSLHLPSIG
ncbi:trichohyalin [Helicoverpa armigera]|uniref:trichohyalin n=1 Tax=Helicoverpa armigera TaxID=29058 RepID=UPI003083C79A